MYYYTPSTLNLRIHETYVCRYGPVVDMINQPPICDHIATVIQLIHSQLVIRMPSPNIQSQTAVFKQLEFIIITFQVCVHFFQYINCISKFNLITLKIILHTQFERVKI